MIYVVICWQGYANYQSVVGVYSTLELAEKKKAEDSDYIIEEFTLDKF